MCLRGTKQAELQWLSGKRLSKQVTDCLPSIRCVWPSVTLNLMHTAEVQDEKMVHELKILQQEYDDVFAIPIELPP